VAVNIDERTRRARLIQHEIAETLRRNWGPIGIKDVSEDQDEYDAYVGGVYRLLESGATVKDLAAHLVKAQIRDTHFLGVYFQSPIIHYFPGGYWGVFSWTPIISAFFLSTFYQFAIRYVEKRRTMTMPRSQYVQEGREGIFHCFNRCVRRAFLCGFDSVTGRNFSHKILDTHVL
jgi:hypothetical protein